MSTIHVEKLNEVFLHVYADDMGIEAEMSEFFAYYVEGYRFMPKFKARVWDGKLRLWHDLRKTLYVGLYPYLVQFAKNNGYLINNINEIEEQNPCLLAELDQYTQKLNIHSKNVKITAHDYQLDAINRALTCKRCMLISPTASGKSLIIYTICRYLMEQGKKCLIIVPNTSLVEQMYSDFEDYSSHNGWSTTNNCQKIYFGFPKIIESNTTFSTWQSIYKLPTAWFAQFDCIIGDECLHPDTLISMSDYSTKKIKDINEGDVVLTFNEKTNIIEPKPVIKVHHNISINEQMYKIGLSDGTFVKITGNHKVLLESKQWKRVDELEIGDIINSIE